MRQRFVVGGTTKFTTVKKTSMSSAIANVDFKVSNSPIVTNLNFRNPDWRNIDWLEFYE